MAAPQIYVCAADYPKKIPSFLAAAGLSVRAEENRFPRRIARRGSFVYVISEGPYTLDVFGGLEDDGTACFFVYGRWSWSPWSHSAMRQLRDRVVSILLREGAHVLTKQELIAYEKNKKSA